MGFSSCQAIGELIHIFNICHVDISLALITLSQHSAAPSKIYYDAIKQVFLYLYATKQHRIMYWWSKLRKSLLSIPHFGTVTKEEQLVKYDDMYDSMTLHGVYDANCASNKNQWWSMGSVILLLAGVSVYYRTNLQPTIALIK